MKKVFTVFWIALIILMVVAFFTKPSYDYCLLRISHELNIRGFQAGLVVHRDSTQKVSSVTSPVTIKDRVFYRDIYFPINGKQWKIAVAAFNKLYLVN